MSLENALVIIDHALRDANYLNLLLTRPSLALEGYELTEAESAMLSNLSASPYTAASRGLIETRKLIQAGIDFMRDTK